MKLCALSINNEWKWLDCAAAYTLSIMTHITYSPGSTTRLNEENVKKHLRQTTGRNLTTFVQTQPLTRHSTNTPGARGQAGRARLVLMCRVVGVVAGGGD